ncbi:hypothetical protein [Xenorhabdus budapestensis]|uniref:Uncharacterized protein n=1 Tax=Xenorhabdus budapestensis TaxID=290110 RepID=A0ABX7VGM3_XENBU|nr:hypothetical protein [Xenorhabdus budapestensis]QTL38585.1 hypothetical protein HGO23_11835 [Xenorhabdus budapestensis]
MEMLIVNADAMVDGVWMKRRQGEVGFIGTLAGMENTRKLSRQMTGLSDK